MALIVAKDPDLGLTLAVAEARTSKPWQRDCNEEAAVWVVLDTVKNPVIPYDKKVRALEEVTQLTSDAFGLPFVHRLCRDAYAQAVSNTPTKNTAASLNHIRSAESRTPKVDKPDQPA